MRPGESGLPLGGRSRLHPWGFSELVLHRRPRPGARPDSPRWIRLRIRWEVPSPSPASKHRFRMCSRSLAGPAPPRARYPSQGPAPGGSRIFALGTVCLRLVPFTCRRYKYGVLKASGNSVGVPYRWGLSPSADPLRSERAKLTSTVEEHQQVAKKSRAQAAGRRRRWVGRRNDVLEPVWAADAAQ